MVETESSQYDEESDNGEGIYYEYDYLDRPVLTKYPDGSRKQSVHDMDGNVLQENLLPVTAEDTESRATRYVYDGRGYRVSEQAPDGGVTYFERDRNGNLLKTIRPEEYAESGRNGAGITYEYDSENRLTGILDDKGNPFRRYIYDQKGRLAESVEGDAPRGTRYVYDLAGRLTEKWAPVREAEDTGSGMAGVPGDNKTRGCAGVFIVQ